VAEGEAPAPGAFDRDTAVVLEHGSERESTFAAEVSPDWRAGRGPHGGYLAAILLPWRFREVSDLEPPEVDPPDSIRASSGFPDRQLPPFVRHLVLQPRIGMAPPAGGSPAMEVGAWLGLAEPRPLDALALAFYCDALLPAPFARLRDPAVAPTVDLTVHFRTRMPRAPDPDPHELCLVRTTTRVIHEGFFEEDGVIWAADGSVLAQSRQLAILLGA
jgi:hypothetical protein